MDETPTSPIPQTKPFPLNPILITISVFSLLATTLLIYQNWLLNQKLQQLIATQTTIQTTITTPTPTLDTTNWKTYVNSKYGFSVNYPQSFSVTEDVKTENYYDKIVTLTGSEKFINFSMTITSLTDIDIYATSTAESIADRESNDSGIDHAVSSKTINQYQSAEVHFAGNPETIDVYIKHPSKNIITKISLNLASKDNEDLLNQILATFKFTEVSTIPSSWKTYSLPQYGYEFKYPSDLRVYGETESFVNLTYIPVCDPLVKSCLFIPFDKFKGTNFKGAGFGVNIISTFKTEKTCLSQQFKSDLGEKNINGYKFHLYADGGAATGNQESSSIYLTFANNKCYRIINRITTDSSDINSPSGTVMTFTETQRQSLDNLFSQILSTFKLPPL